MIIKQVLKTLLLFSFLGSAIFIVTWGGFRDKHRASNIILHEHKNNASKIKYTFKTKCGTINLIANEVIFIKTNTIKLHKVNATYKTKNKNISMKSDSCIYSIKEKKVYLSNNVIIKSDLNSIKTKKAVIDIQKQSIYSKSKTYGVANELKIDCSGFTINNAGIINLINAKSSYKSPYHDKK